MRDMLSKGRENLKGGLKLSDEQVVEIRKRFQSGDHRIGRIALDYGIGKGNISAITQGTSREAGKELLTDKKPLGWAHRGERSTSSKLTWEQVEAIRAAYSNGVATYRQLGQRYGITGGLVGLIVRRLVWKIDSIQGESVAPMTRSEAGKKGGKARMRNMTIDQRNELGRFVEKGGGF
ncbi:MAG: hypothetical protein Q7K03_10615 [Dehalococcoidia bacterium]|nr:hypothetical protein [Dehalococcoidia bacterium]